MDNTQGYRSRISSIKGRVAVVGDLHGDLQTLRKIIDCLSLALDSGAINKVVFLGDIMDRGSDSAQTLLELLKFFNHYEGKIYIVRGNHETIAMFDRESTDGYIAARSDPYFSGIDNEVFRAFFDKLLVGVIINKHTLAVHGGIPCCSLWGKFFEREKIPEGAPGYDVIYSAMWADYFALGDAISVNLVRTGGEIDYRIVRYNEKCVTSFFKFCEEHARGKDYHEHVKDLKYLIHAHQHEYGTFHKSPEEIVTVVFSALKNQGDWISQRGAKVALVTEDDAPPSEYLTIRGIPLTIPRG